MAKIKPTNVFNIGSTKNNQGVEKILEQTGKRISVPRDAARSAQLPGKRVSRTGKTYWETRKNRSDAPFKNI